MLILCPTPGSMSAVSSRRNTVIIGSDSTELALEDTELELDSILETELRDVELKLDELISDELDCELDVKLETELKLKLDVVILEIDTELALEDSEFWLDEIENEVELELTGITLDITLEFATDAKLKLELVPTLLKDGLLDIELRLDALEVVLELTELVVNDDIEFGIDEAVPPSPPPPPQAVKTARLKAADEKRMTDKNRENCIKAL